MAKKVYVGNMNYATTEQSLRALFAQYGDVSAVNVISDRYTGQAKGFAFIEMDNDDAATAAIAALNGQVFEGRQLRVNEAIERPRREFSGPRDY
jgi:RNA recognition motif-containing protein